MSIRITFDIQSQQKVYAIIDTQTSQCTKLTTSLVKAIQFAKESNN